MSSMRYIVFIVSANVEVLADAKCDGQVGAVCRSPDGDEIAFARPRR